MSPIESTSAQDQLFFCHIRQLRQILSSLTNEVMASELSDSSNTTGLNFGRATIESAHDTQSTDTRTKQLECDEFRSNQQIELLRHSETRATLSKSNFMTFLRDFTCKTDIETVIQGIEQVARDKGLVQGAEELVRQLNAYPKQESDLFGLVCLRLYTGNTFLPKMINTFLRRYEADKIPTLGPIFKVLDEQFDKYSTKLNCRTVYRGERLRFADLVRYKHEKKNKKLGHWSGITSASKERPVAEMFVRNCLLIIRLKKKYGKGKVLDISDLSIFKEENEVVFRSGTEYNVRRYEYTRTGNKYTFYLTAYI